MVTMLVTDCIQPSQIILQFGSTPPSNQSRLCTPFCRFSFIALVQHSARTVYADVSLLDSVCFVNAVFTARCYASAVLAMALCPSVCHKSEFYQNG